jgi:hypothetical protein
MSMPLPLADRILFLSTTGGGIRVDKMARLFKPFDRLGAERSRVRAPAWAWPCPRA